MLDKDAYIQRLARQLDAHGELGFLERLTPDELSVLWGKVARQALSQRHTAHQTTRRSRVMT